MVAEDKTILEKFAEDFIKILKICKIPYRSGLVARIKN